MSIAAAERPPETRRTANALAGLTVTPMTCRIGAEIGGIDARQPVPEDTRAELNALLDKWKVIFFRDQPVTTEQHMRFAETWGPIIRDYGAARDPDHATVQKVRGTYGNINKWHTDTSWMVRPAKAAVLHGVVIPDVGGDTMWADGVAAYNGLPDDVKERIADLDAVHDATNIHKGYGKDDPRYEELRQQKRDMRKQHPLVAQPIVRTHPQTGEKSLYINDNLTTFVVGMAPEEGAELLQYLQRQYQRPEYTVRFRWRKDSIAVWDQRQTQHYAVNDYPMGTARQLNRILVASEDVPHR